MAVGDSDKATGRGFAQRLDRRRKQGPSAQEQLRGPNTGTWEKVFSGWNSRERWNRKSAVSDPERFRPKDSTQQ